MTAIELLAMARTAGIRLETIEDRLRVDAPAGALTPKLRDALAMRKSELLIALKRPRAFVTLKPDMRTGFAPTLPIEAIELAIDLEQRGFEMWLDQWEQVVIAPAQELSDRDRAAIARWRLHLGAIVGYSCDAPPIA